MADKYWVGGSGIWGTATTHWGTESGGSGGEPVPDDTDNVVIDDASGSPIIQLNQNISIGSFVPSATNFVLYTNDHNIQFSLKNSQNFLLDCDVLSGKIFWGFSAVTFGDNGGIFRISGANGVFDSIHATFGFYGSDQGISVHPNTIDFKIGEVDVGGSGFFFKVDAGS